MVGGLPFARLHGNTSLGGWFCLKVEEGRRHVTRLLGLMLAVYIYIEQRLLG